MRNSKSVNVGKEIGGQSPSPPHYHPTWDGDGDGNILQSRKAVWLGHRTATLNAQPYKGAWITEQTSTPIGSVRAGTNRFCILTRTVKDPFFRVPNESIAALACIAGFIPTGNVGGTDHIGTG
jgi:hypothetical protein